MRKMVQYSVLLISVYFMLVISCDMPSDPFKKPSNSKARLFLEENEQTIDFGSEIKIGVSIFLAEHIEALHIFTRNNGLDSIHHYNSNAVDDTLYFNHKFTVEGKDTIFVTGKLKNKNYMNKTDTFPVFILPAPDSVYFDSIADPVYTLTGKIDTLGFVASARSEKALEFSVKSDPKIDSGLLEVIQAKDTARVIIRTDKSGKYSITLYAKRDSLIDSASVKVTVYEPLLFKNVILPDIVTSGKSDTLVFILPTEREDTLTCKLLNRNDFSESEISILSETADSFVVVFTPETNGKHEFVMLITNGHIKDTLNYEILVSEKIPVWNITEKTIDAVEGEEISVDLRDFMNEKFSGDFSLGSDSGKIKDTVWKWTPPWGSDTTKTAVISAVCDSDEYKLKLNVSVVEGDTTGPTIRLLHSSMNDTVIGSSQINVEAVVKDFGAGVSSVQISYGSKSASMGLIEDSIYIYPVKDLKSGERTEIKIVAQDGSMRKNVTEYVFYITYDTTIGDNVAPVISQESGPENGGRVTDGQILLSFSVTDDSDIDSVYWTLEGTFKGILARDDNIFSLSDKFGEYGSNEIEIFAVDRSVNRNRSSFKLVYDYNTEITGVEIISPENGASGFDTSGVTFKWSGGNDEDGDTVFIELLYDTSKTNLKKKITGINVNTLVLQEELNSYTDYYWQVIAYSKVYPDTVRSSVYSFKTEAVPPKIITQPGKNIDVDIGEKVVLQVNATGNPEPSYRWKKNEKVISGETKDSLVIGYAALDDSGEYVVEVYNEEGDTVKSNKIDLRIIYPVKIAAGGDHSHILKNNGTLWACGYNHFGQLGNGTNDNINDPVEIMNNVADIAVGYYHSLILKSDGSLWSCGLNRFGQLGNKSNDDINDPEKIMDDVANIAAGGNHSLIMKKNGTLWACGDNYCGQLGDGTKENKSTPVRIIPKSTDP
ncbi:MAG: hypothetical protein GXY77_03360 [Fibrobacter sp.]|nr:hypothetical protein [Fibrobacter sp.]